ncbi:hypothetical protein V7S43_015494 [Phytophthora oleae]|uniref:Ankyrin repeat protein n=1 Tax=Phytophthora oleae TaxID=2107226 RepID=A0ABD3EY78_9STRA
MITAADHGRLDVVKWLHGHGVQPTTAAIGCTARSVHLTVVEWLLQHHTDRCIDLLLDGAAAKGRLNIVQYLHEKLNADCTTSAMDGAARVGHLHAVQWLHFNMNAGCTTSAMD